jgi:hypothetical protein
LSGRLSVKVSRASGQLVAALAVLSGLLLVPAYAAQAQQSVPAVASTAHRVVGHGTPGSCTSAGVVRAVHLGGVISFNCGPGPVTIAIHATAKLENTSHRVVLNGGGKITLDGGGKHRILYLNTCDQKQTWTTPHCNNQKWPQLTVENITFAHAYSGVKEGPHSSYGGGAIFAQGGRLAVTNTNFIDNRCYRVGPDLGGAAIRALQQWHNLPVAITHDTFRGGRCANGSALSSIGVSWTVRDSTFTNNRAIGHGANPAKAGSPGGGSGGAIYTDGDHYVVLIENSTMSDNRAREGGGAIIFVSDDGSGRMAIRNSTLRNNPSHRFWTRPYPGIFYLSSHHPLRVVNSTIR